MTSRSGPFLASAQGYVERMGRDGDVGRWLRSLAPFDVVDAAGTRVLFVHGGIPAELRDPWDLAAYAEAYVEHVRNPTCDGGHEEKYLQDRLVDGLSVFWDRDIPLEKTDLSDLREDLRVDAIVIGHTVLEEIGAFDERIFGIDVGMVRGGDPSAIVFRPEGIFAFNARTGEEAPEDEIPTARPRYR